MCIWCWLWPFRSRLRYGWPLLMHVNTYRSQKLYYDISKNVYVTMGAHIIQLSQSFSFIMCPHGCAQISYNIYLAKYATMSSHNQIVNLLLKKKREKRNERKPTVVCDLIDEHQHWFLQFRDSGKQLLGDEFILVMNANNRVNITDMLRMIKKNIHNEFIEK